MTSLTIDAAISYGTAIILFSGALVTLLSLKFLTRKKHEEKCSVVQKDLSKRFCEKIDKLQEQINTGEKMRNLARSEQHLQNLWMVQAMQKIADKVGADIESFPKHLIS